jgi:hypothetical protein
MKFKINQKYVIKFRLLIIPIFILTLFACATTPTKTYNETVLEWKSHKDVAKWMGRHFTYDMTRFRETEGMYPISRSPEETFKLKSGVCYDGAYFVRDVLNRMDPSYEAQVVFIENRPYAVNHFVTSFKKDGKLFIMDYATTYRNMVGVHGPYNSLDEYKKFYERNHPKVKHVQSIRYW